MLDVVALTFSDGGGDAARPNDRLPRPWDCSIASPAGIELLIVSGNTRIYRINPNNPASLTEVTSPGPGTDGNPAGLDGDTVIWSSKTLAASGIDTTKPSDSTLMTLLATTDFTKTFILPLLRPGL